MRLEATIISGILYLFGQGNFIFISEKSGNFESYTCINHALILHHSCGTFKKIISGDKN